MVDYTPWFDTAASVVGAVLSAVVPLALGFLLVLLVIYTVFVFGDDH